MTLLAAVTSAGFRDAVLVYLAVAFVSFVAAGSIFWRRRRQAGRHTGSALMLAMFVAAMQLLVIASLARLTGGTYEQAYFRDLMLASAVILLPAFFISSFLMAASGSFLAERAGICPWPVSRAFQRGEPGRWRSAGTSLAVALVAGGLALAYSVSLFFAAQRITGSPPRAAEGTEDIAIIFSGRILLVVGFGLAAAFWEEIFVRLFLLNALFLLFRRARGGAAAAVIVSSAVWAAGHAGTMEPELVKFLQVFLIGIMLGIVFIRRGIESCLASHSAFNIGILIVGGFQ